MKVLKDFNWLGIAVLAALFLMFAGTIALGILKLAGVLDISTFTVFVPFWGPALIMACVAIIVVVAGVIYDGLTW